MGGYDDDDDRQIDWERSQVSSRAQVQDARQFTGLGDPTRWGAEESVAVTVANSIANPKYTQQLVRMQALDPYPRNWQLIGHVELSGPMLEELLATPSTEQPKWVATLEITMGIGQAIVLHRVNLRALLLLALGATPPTLNTNAWYLPEYNGDRFRVAWVLPGGVVGRTVSVRAAFAVAGGGEDDLALPQSISVACALSPFAAGGDL